MEKVLWNEGDGHKSFLIHPNEIEEQIYLGDYSFIIDGIDILKIDVEELTEKLNTHTRQYPFLYDHDIEEFLISIGFEDARVNYYSKYYAHIENKLVFHEEDNVFYNLAEGNKVVVYRWLDGSNVQTIECTEDVTITKLEVSDNYVDLDKWDGRNYTTGGIGEHQNIRKVLKLNGEKKEDTFLISYGSEWQGSHNYGEIKHLDSVIIHLKEIGREVETYLELLKEI